MEKRRVEARNRMLPLIHSYTFPTSASSVGPSYTEQLHQESLRYFRATASVSTQADLTPASFASLPASLPPICPGAFPTCSSYKFASLINRSAPSRKINKFISPFCICGEDDRMVANAKFHRQAIDGMYGSAKGHFKWTNLNGIIF